MGEWFNNFALNSLAPYVVFLAAGAILSWLVRRFYVFDRIKHLAVRRFNARDKVEELGRVRLGEIDALIDGGELIDFRLGDVARMAATTSAPDDHWACDPDLLAAARIVRAERYHPPKGENRPHGVITGSPRSLRATQTYPFIGVDYALITAARAAGHKPHIMSAGGIVFCPSAGKVLLQQRSDKVETFPGKLHVLGGNYEPATLVNENDDLREAGKSGLRRTAIREIHEESGLAVTLAENHPHLVFHEDATGFIGLVFLGVAVGSTQLSGVVGTHQEGGVKFYSFKEIGDLAEAGQLAFVPTGLQTLMFWLSLGAPDGNCNLPCRKQALACYDRLKANLSKIDTSI